MTGITGKFNSRRRSRSRIPAGLLVTVALFVAACTSNGETVTTQTTSRSSETPPASTSGTAQSPGGTGLAEGSTSTVVGLEPKAAIVEPGSLASFAAGRDLSGDLRLVAPDGREITGTMADGRAELPVPGDAPEGEYLVVVDGDDETLGVGAIVVAAGPSLWLRSDRRSVGPAGDVVVRLDAHGVPDDALVLFGRGDLDLAAYVEDEADGDAEPLGFLVPDADGLLQPGYDPVPLGEVAGRSLLMSGMQVAGLQALVVDPAGDDALYSNFLALAGCAESSRLSGTIGGPGTVRILSTGDGLRSAGVVTGDGNFTLDGPHGLLTAFGFREDGQLLESIAVDLPCGAEAFLDLPRGEAEVAAPEEPVLDVDDGFVAGESGSLTFTGDFEIEFPVEPICTYKESEIKIAFATYDSDLPAVLLFVDGGETSDNYGGRLEITDWLSGAAQSQGSAEIGIIYTPEALLAEGTFDLEARYAGAAGDGSVTGTFTCTVLGLVPPVGSEQTVDVVEEVFDLFAVAPVGPFDTLGPDPGVAAPACRNFLIEDRNDPATGALLAATLREHLPRAAVVTRSEIDWLLAAGPGGYLGPGRSSEVAFAVTGAAPDLVLIANGDDQAISLDVRPVPRPAYFDGAVLDEADPTLEQGYARDRSDAWTVEAPLDGIATALAEGILCVDVDDIWAVPGEAADLIVSITDLAGTPVDGVTVETDGGGPVTVDPAVGTTAGGTFQASATTSESGSSQVTVDAGGEQWRSTSALARIRSASAYSLQGQYRVVLNPDDDAPIAPGPLSVTLVARSCFGMSGTWRGVMYIEAGPYLSLLQTAGAVLSGLNFSLRDPGVSAVGSLVPFGDETTLGSGGPTTRPVSDGFFLSVFGTAVETIDPSKAIPVPVSFHLPPAGGRVDMVVAGVLGTGFKGRYNGRRALMQVSVDGLHLLTARIGAIDACDPFELDQNFADFLDAFEQWSDEHTP